MAAPLALEPDTHGAEPGTALLRLWVEPPDTLDELASPDTLDKIVLDLEAGPRRLHYMIGAAALGLGDDLDHSPIADWQSSIAAAGPLARVVNRLASWQELRAIRLGFGSPRGHLPAVPWEQLLFHALPSPVPVLRQPYLPLQPLASRGSLRIALCASAPRAKGSWPVPDLVTASLRAFSAAAEHVQVEIFASQADAAEIAAEVDAPGRWYPHVTIHPPQDAARYGVTERSATIPAEGTNPWLEWISASLHGRSVDVVHFICPGYTSAGAGALALAESPLRNADPSWARFIGTAQLARFARQTGAWSLHLTSPLPRRWGVGLRLLADEMAWQRPGPVLLQEVRHGSRITDDLEAACQYLYRGSGQPPPVSDELVLYARPRLPDLRGSRRQPRGPASSTSPAIAGLTLTGGAAAEIEGPQPTPAWLAADQRYLEQRAARLPLAERLPQRADEEAAATGGMAVELEAVRRGAEDALEFVARAIERYQGEEGAAQ